MTGPRGAKMLPAIRAVRGAVRTRAKLPMRVFTASDATRGLSSSVRGEFPSTRNIMSSVRNPPE